MAIQVRSLQVKTRKDVPYREGMTVGQALEKAKDTLPHGGMITVNGQPATLDTVVSDGAKVVVTPPVDNG